MRRAIVLLSIVLGAWGAVITPQVSYAKGPPVIAPTSRRFDHDRHAASASAAGKPVNCAGCHDDKPKSEHARCAGCHTFPSSCSVMQTPGVAGPARVCQTCHTPTRRECLPKDLPPLPVSPSFAATFTHAKHLAVGSSIERDCGVCHRAQAEPPKEKPHVLCSGCHNPNGAKPTMVECTSCHVTSTAKPGTTGPAGPAGPDLYRLSSFDHKAHTTASKLTACLSCHDKPVGDAPKPSMLGCQTRCHDGQKAFSATGTHCTRCHKGTTPAPATRTDLSFSHAEHRKRNVKIDDCAACHVLEPDGMLAAPLSRKDHLPCANPSCHQSEYNARAPKICGICHDAAVPWAKTAARPGKRRGVEWFEAMNHASHLAKGKVATCEACHGDKRTGGAAPRDHSACATCHARGQAPAMTDCASCHSTTRRSPMQASTWNVAATFDHTKHAVDPRSHRPTACAECHTQITAAKDMASVAPPRMADCDGCHDGKTAFKTTGFGCVRCHGSKPQAVKSEAVKSGAARSETVKAEAAKSEAAKSEAAKSEAAKSEAALFERVSGRKGFDQLTQAVIGFYERRNAQRSDVGWIYARDPLIRWSTNQTLWPAAGHLLERKLGDASGNAPRSEAGWVSSRDKLHGRVVGRRPVVEMALTVIVIRRSTDERRTLPRVASKRVCVLRELPSWQCEGIA